MTGPRRTCARAVDGPEKCRPAPSVIARGSLGCLHDKRTHPFRGPLRLHHEGCLHAADRLPHWTEAGGVRMLFARMDPFTFRPRFLAKIATGFLVGKFEGRYSISRTKLESSRARRAGKSSTRLLLLLQEGQGDLDWVLLHVHGVKLDSSEKWRDAISDRVTVTGYELVRLTKPDEPRPVWTWRYTKSRHDELRNEIIAWCLRSF